MASTIHRAGTKRKRPTSLALLLESVSDTLQTIGNEHLRRVAILCRLYADCERWSVLTEGRQDWGEYNLDPEASDSDEAGYESSEAYAKTNLNDARSTWTVASNSFDAIMETYKDRSLSGKKNVHESAEYKEYEQWAKKRWRNADDTE